MVYDPFTTFVIYIVAILAVFTLAAFVAERWDAKARRDARRQARVQARADARAERTEGAWF
jgi:hypothetical protein